jgi:glyoxylase-like metal-dependent hydrolase (beta-lactamase superfamily II)
MRLFFEERKRAMSEAMYLCVTCGTQYPVEDAPPASCPICEDDRQYINPAGQQWTTLERLRGAHSNTLTDIAPGITTIATSPAVGIGQRAYLLQTPAGNVLWDCLAYLDQSTIAAIQARGGLAAIAISHPHFYTTMVDWSHAFGGVPIYLHADNQPWVMRPDPVIRFFEGERATPLADLPDLRVIRLGGHFPGSAVLHWPQAAEGSSALFTGDTIMVAADPRWVTFMYSFPNRIPLGERAIRRIVAGIDPLTFSRLYDGWTEARGDAKDAVLRSAERYIAHIRD